MQEIKYIFPINYNRSEKILGIFDYKTVIISAIWCIFIFCILKNSGADLKICINIFISAGVFPSILICVGVNGESMLSFGKCLIKYLVKDKVYVYRKE